MAIYTKIQNKEQLSTLTNKPLKRNINLLFNLFFKETPDRNQLINSGLSVLFLQKDTVELGNLECIPDYWEEKSYQDFVETNSA